MSFDDFVRLFELERETSSKKQKLNVPDHDTSRTGAYNLESSPNPDNSFRTPETGNVVLRRNPRRMTLPARLQHRSKDLPFLSPIPSQSPVPMRPPSNDLTGNIYPSALTKGSSSVFTADLASQMKYLTDANESVDSPQLKRSSKVLSWIESEDMLFEDTGTGNPKEKECTQVNSVSVTPLQGFDAVPSPPLSPTHAHDEASHVGIILESVCNTKEISSTAIARLCDHVKADPQEQQVSKQVVV